MHIKIGASFLCLIFILLLLVQFFYTYFNAFGLAYIQYKEEKEIDVAPNRYITNTFLEGETGGLGNQLYRFAALYGIGRELDRKVYFDGNHKRQLKGMSIIAEIFPLVHDKIHIKFPIKEDVYHARRFGLPEFSYDNSTATLKNVTHQYLRIEATWLQVYKYFHPKYTNELRRLFECGHVVMRKVKKLAEKLFKYDKSHILCTHVRRGDFLSKSTLQETTAEYTLPALKYILSYLKANGHTNVSLLFIGNDQRFVKDLDLKKHNFVHKYLPENLSKGEDMCLGINYCDSMLLTASGSTFGWWIAYLMRPNSTIFYNTKVSRKKIHKKERYDFNCFPDDWISVNVHKNGTVSRETRWYNERIGKKFKF